MGKTKQAHIVLSWKCNEIALASEMGADAVDPGKTIHPQPALGERVGMAADVAHGSCTGLPLVRKWPDCPEDQRTAE